MGERNMDCLPPVHTLLGIEPAVVDMCYDWELNLWPLSSWDNAQPAKPHQAGREYNIKGVSCWSPVPGLSSEGVHIICL